MNEATIRFIKKAKEIHGNKYDYTRTEYVNARTKVCIICPEHGEFWQTPSHHLQRRGCPKCIESVLETKVRVLLENNNIKYIQFFRTPFLRRKSIDFYIPKYNVGIECQGLQHFIDVDYYKFNTRAVDQIKNDEEKFNLCKKRGIHIVYFTDKNFLKYGKLTDIYRDNLTSDENDLLIRLRTKYYTEK